MLCGDGRAADEEQVDSGFDNSAPELLGPLWGERCGDRDPGFSDLLETRGDELGLDGFAVHLLEAHPCLFGRKVGQFFKDGRRILIPRPEALEVEDAHAAEPFVADPQVAAFFDVDNTLIQGASIILLARGLAKHKFFTASDLFGLAWSQAKFRISGEENADDVASGRDKALAFVEGRTVAELTALSEEVVDTSMLDRVWPGTRALVQMHLDAGQQVWLVTATPLMLARVIATGLPTIVSIGMSLKLSEEA